MNTELTIQDEVIPAKNERTADVFSVGKCEACVCTVQSQRTSKVQKKPQYASPKISERAYCGLSFLGEIP
jgi:hypothetical protein